MSFTSRRRQWRRLYYPFAIVIAGLLMLALVQGCGSSKAKSKSTPVSTAGKLSTPPKVSTPAVASTLTVTGGSVAAIVNGRPVPMSTYRLLLRISQRQTSTQPGMTTKTLADRTMNQLIVFELVSQYASAHHITVSNSEIDARIKRDERAAGGVKPFKQKLSEFGLTISTYGQLLRPSLLGPKVEQAVAPLSTKPQPVAHIRHILISTRPQGKPPLSDAAARAKAQKVLAEVQHGGNWAKLAKQNSDDPGSAPKGGDLGNVYPHQTVPPFDHAAFTLPLHQPAIVHSQYGYHVMEVLSRGKAAVPPQSQSQTQQQRFSAWLSGQMRTAKIKRIAKVKGSK